jgi:hypothetical protein
MSSIELPAPRRVVVRPTQACAAQQNDPQGGVNQVHRSEEWEWQRREHRGS